MNHPEIVIYPSNPTLEGLAELIPDIVYSSAGGAELKLSLIVPWRAENDARRHPLVVFVQGSAWTTPNPNYEVPQLSQLARAGIAVATISHRSSLDGFAFPAYLEDTKTAIRFLRAHADEYRLDPGRVCVYGTSSGGNTALLVGLTGDDPAFKTREYPEVSDAVQCVVECFGPTDLPAMVPSDPAVLEPEFAPIFLGLAGDLPLGELYRRMSPVHYVRDGARLPPTLVVHGDADLLVPYEQGLAMYERLVAAGAKARMIRVSGGPHEGSFWSAPLIEDIFAFIKSNIG